MDFPRIMMAAPSSGSGKTLVTCGLLKALVERGMRAVSFKCGPDYIDPMFHRAALKVPAHNLDTFFTGEEATRRLFAKGAAQADISLLEGVMGFYDGAGGVNAAASSYELAKVTGAPVILVVNVKGMSLSALPLIKGFLEFRPDSGIKGVILNQASASLYPMLKEKIEQELQVEVFGYVPKCPDFVLESRHLGLVTPTEVEKLQEKLTNLANLLEGTLDIEKILACANAAPELPEPGFGTEGTALADKSVETVRVGVAWDEAFCFCYKENLELLEELGAELIYFSPLHDKALPSGLQGMVLYGGYPELYAQALSENSEMRRQIRMRLKGGTPFLAECGGFLYLQEYMEDMQGREFPMAGVFPGRSYNTGKLGRFGYLTLSAREGTQLLEPGECIRGHEFHYYDCTENGGVYHGKKPFGSREWDCMQGGENYAAGFPHLYYHSNPRFVERFLQKCRDTKERK